MHFLCDKSACQCLTKITAIQCGLADSDGHSVCFSLQEFWPKNTEHRFVIQSRYKPERTNIDGWSLCALVDAFSTSDCEIGKETVPSQLLFKFSVAPLLADQTACGPLRGFFREAFVLHAHAFPMFSCEHAGGRLEVKSSFIVSFSGSLVTL